MSTDSDPVCGIAWQPNGVLYGSCMVFESGQFSCPSILEPRRDGYEIDTGEGSRGCGYYLDPLGEQYLFVGDKVVAQFLSKMGVLDAVPIWRDHMNRRVISVRKNPDGTMTTRRPVLLLDNV